jgi:hypothetical protein
MTAWSHRVLWLAPQPTQDCPEEHRAFAPVDGLQNTKPRRYHDVDLGTFGPGFGRYPDVLASAAQRRPALCVSGGLV